MKAQTVGSKKANMSKNLLSEVIAYDHSRVVLEVIDEDPFSDYINASYIKNSADEKVFIATQAPSKFTIPDFWRMIWQEHVGRIVMLINDEEATTEPYWPKLGKQIVYSDVIITLTREETYENCVIRTIELVKGGQHRLVIHLQNIGWSAHDDQSLEASLLDFRWVYEAYEAVCTGPAAVHCSPGLGRSGVFIALDMLMTDAKNQRDVEVRMCVESMHDQRADMILSLNDYIYLYDVLLYCLQHELTSISAASFGEAYKRLRTVNSVTQTSMMKDQFKRLLTLRISHDLASREKKTEANNSHAKSKGKKSTDQICVSNDELGGDNSFIVLVQTLDGDAVDFWRSVYNHAATTVIVLNHLNDQQALRFFPEDSLKNLVMKPYTLSLQSIDLDDDNAKVAKVSLGLSKKSESARYIKIFHLRNWSQTEHAQVPPSLENLVYFIHLIERWLQVAEKGPILIHCSGYMMRCALFVALLQILEKLRKKKTVDIFDAAKKLQQKSPKLSINEEHYQFCYEVIEEYMKSVNV